MGELPRLKGPRGPLSVPVGHDLRASTGVRNEETADMDPKRNKHIRSVEDKDHNRDISSSGKVRILLLYIKIYTYIHIYNMHKHHRLYTHICTSVYLYLILNVETEYFIKILNSLWT